jgi:peptidase E
VTIVKGKFVAMGGGGFSMEPENPLLDAYVLSKARIHKPKVCFIPTASGDSEGYIEKFYNAMSAFECTPCHLPLFRQKKDWRETLASSDVLYIGGGNTRNMLAVWNAAGLVPHIRHAAESGVLLCGLSAGAICWFERGHTDSSGTLGVMECLGLLKGSCSPHFDGETERRPSFLQLVSSGAMPAGYGLDDGAALYFEDSVMIEAISSRPSAKARKVEMGPKGAFEKVIDTRYLGV